MAAVFKAFDPAQQRYVAIKVMSPAMAGEGQFSKRFRREAEVVMRLKHPHIVPVEGFGEQDGFVYLVMPLLKVGSLADRLTKGALTPSEGARIMAQISEALQFAHDQGVVHRDVKPSNILLEENGNALLSDFGLAQIHDASVSLTGSALLGTPAYMSPEQARGDTVDARSDQYSLGVILYQLSTGELPFEAETPMAVLMKHINEPLPPARMKSPNVPPAVERVILKATAKLPQERFGSIAELNQAFQAALAHAQDPFSHPEPKIQVPPSSMSIRASQVELARPRRRGWRVAAALALLMLLLVACPATGLQELLKRSASPAEGSPLLMADMSGPQLTALAGTIEAMSTELALAGGGTLAAEDIPTMVMETLVADAGGDPAEVPTDAAMVLTPLDGPVFTGPTETPSPGPSPTASLTPTKTKTPTPGPSPTPSNTPTKTLTPTTGPSPTPSPTPSASPTSTLGPSPTPSRTPTPTQTSLPSATVTPGMSPSPSATTPVVPTNVAAPTAAPSATEPVAIEPSPLPPSPTPDVCSSLELDDWSVGDHEISVMVSNDSTVTVKIVRLHLDWPPENDRLWKIELDGSKIWDGWEEDPPTDITSGWENPSSRRNVSPGSEKLVFFFDYGPDILPGPYGLGLWFEGLPCGLTGAH
jgi:serine/threonine-protein kinase